MPAAKLPPPKERKPPAPKPKTSTSTTTTQTTSTFYQPAPPPTADFYQTIQSIGSITGDLLTFGFPGADTQPQQQEVFMTSSQMQQYQNQFPTQQPTANPFMTNTASASPAVNPFLTSAQALSSAGLTNVVKTPATTIYPSVEPERFIAPVCSSSFPSLPTVPLSFLFRIQPLLISDSFLSALLILPKQEKLSRPRSINWRASIPPF